MADSYDLIVIGGGTGGNGVARMAANAGWSVATGARPMTLNIPGEEHLATSTDFLDLPERPASPLAASPLSAAASARWGLPYPSFASDSGEMA